MHFPISPLLVGRRDRLVEEAHKLVGAAARSSVGFVPCDWSVCLLPIAGSFLRPRMCGELGPRVPRPCTYPRLAVAGRKIPTGGSGCAHASLIAARAGALAATVGQGADSRFGVLGVDGE